MDLLCHAGCLLLHIRSSFLQIFHPLLCLFLLYGQLFQKVYKSVSLLLESCVYGLHIVSFVFSEGDAGHTDADGVLGAVVLQDLLVCGAFPLSIRCGGLG
ncbi:hypothetical protein GDO81_025507 [Engystomops pustulosus]|uniref:Uncharacterized protein n=1 Tax=Engystomops pustulosus TaxID=76066 RepID=A0AAV6YH75_ENGPU|nr:hypothetical protein GDO81_025507 [Engystomops pustulosus]